MTENVPLSHMCVKDWTLANIEIMDLSLNTLSQKTFYFPREIYVMCNREKLVNEEKYKYWVKI